MTTKEQLACIFQSLQEFNLEGQITPEQAQLGFGGSCDVFRGWSAKHEKMVAIKRMRFIMLDNSSFAKSLAREVRIWSQLDHENVLPFWGFFLEGSSGIPNLISEWMGKGTIVEYMRIHPFDARELCEMICGVASGLSYIHDRNVIHADLKGNNILVADDGRPLIADFGLSISDMSTSLAATSDHGEKGTVRWMARELHWNPSVVPFDPRHTVQTDIWAFGMVICELLTGKVPYASVDKHQVASAISSGVLPQKPEFCDSDDTESRRLLWSIASECWRYIPSERPSALAIRNATKAISSKLPFSPSQDSGTRTSSLEPPQEKSFDFFGTLQEYNLAGLIHDVEGAPIALGSTCDVYRAQSSKHMKPVAVKRIRGFLVNDASFAKTLGMGVRLWSRLDHPNVLPLLGFFLEGSMAIPNIVSEWMNRGTVREYTRNRHLDAQEMCRMIYGIAKGLNYLHTEKRIVHSDLKGSSILVSDDGEPLIAGFLSSMSAVDASLDLPKLKPTEISATGTLRWMAKELLWNSSDGGSISRPRHTTQTDMWAFGMVICELLTREVPYEHLVPYSSAARNEPQILKVILEGSLPEAPDFSRLENGAVFRALWGIARKCWNETPEKRPSARDVLNGLEFFVDDI